MSVSKGFGNMLKRAKDLDADVVQYFPKNPKTFRVRVFDRDAFHKEHESTQDLGIITVSHSPYVTNLATPGTNLREVSIASIANDLEIAEAYGTPYLVVHCGKHVGEGTERGLLLMKEIVDEVLTRYTGSVQLLLENTAGQGSELGRTTDELLSIHESIDARDRVGFCFDTCHAYAAGLLDFSRWDEVCTELGRSEFRDKVKVIHLNDSKAPFNTNKDRHELLGQGEIGSEAIGKFLTSGLFNEVPIVIETPVDEEQEYAGEIAKARQWVNLGD
jgi:deoxyribonuclease-4